jgi:predicted patatin/cPLA2 family phospholipase
MLTEKVNEDAFLVGLSYLNTDNAASAITWLAPFLNSNSSFQEDAEFYTALAYIKTKEYKKADEIVQKIIKQKDHLYRQQFSKKTVQQLKVLQWRE